MLLDGMKANECQTVVPGFEFADHDFLREEMLDGLLREEQAEEVRWLLREE